MALPTLTQQDQPITIPADMMRELSYSMVARYFPSNYPKQLIMQEIQDRVRMTKYLRSLALTSRRFSVALETFLGLVKAMLPTFKGADFIDLSKLITTKIDSIAEKIELFTATIKSKSTSALGGSKPSFGSSMMASLAAGGMGTAAISSLETGESSYTPSTASKATTAVPEPARKILDLMADSEGADYNTQFRYQNTTGGKPLTSLSIGQVMQAQRSQSGSSAIGRYQFMAATLPEAMRGSGLTLNDQFSAENQDKMAMYLLKRRGYDSWAAGKISNEQFGLRLSQEWASIPNPYTGSSYYGQNVKYGTDVLLQVLQQAKGAKTTQHQGQEVEKLASGGFIPENQPQQLALLHAGEVVGRPEEIARQMQLAGVVPKGKPQRQQVLIVPVLMGQK